MFDTIIGDGLAVQFMAKSSRWQFVHSFGDEAGDLSFPLLDLWPPLIVGRLLIFMGRFGGILT